MILKRTQSVLSLLESSAGDASFWCASLTATINNVAPKVIGLARATCSKMMQMLVRLSKPAFLLGPESNVVLLAGLLGAVNTIIECHERDHENEAMLYAVWRARERFEALRELSLLDEEKLSSLELPSSPSSPRQPPNAQAQRRRQHVGCDSQVQS